MNERPVAQGNYKVGYRGVIIRDWAKPTEKTIARCLHRHSTTKAARSCIAAAWFLGEHFEFELERVP